MNVPTKPGNTLLPVEIIGPSADSNWTAKLLVDGVDIPHLSNIKFEYPAGEIARVEAHIQAVGGFRIALPCAVTIIVQAFPGYTLRENIDKQSGARIINCKLAIEKRDGDVR